jgi:hypothetical protein
MDLSQIPQSEIGTIQIKATEPEFLLKLQIASEGRELLKILPNGDVIAPDIASASEAGRVFIDSIQIAGKSYIQQIQELKIEIEKLKQEKNEMYQGDQIF